MTSSWQRLVRFQSAPDAVVRFGEPIVDDDGADVESLARAGALQVKVCEGSDPFNLRVTDQVDRVHQLFGPLTPDSVPRTRCIGLNCKSHSRWHLSIFLPSSQISPC